MSRAYRHTARRVRERYGLRLSWRDYHRLARQIYDHLPKLDALPARGNRLIVEYPHHGHPVRWIYCPRERRLCTALAPLRRTA